MPRIAPLAFLLALLACGSDPVLYPVPEARPDLRVASRFPTIEVRDVSLPLYAAAEEIAVLGEGGALVGVDDRLWADDPVRSVTLSLARHLTEITRARVAPEPWPFESYPAARVDVRVEEALVTPAGAFRMRGQYFVADVAGYGGDRARLFDLSAAVSDPASPAAMAAARAVLVAELAERIARDGLAR